jgi:mRNA-degrading endonuclease YafQ of YafQ-DinJ toxin-antitoxin module
MYVLSPAKNFLRKAKKLIAKNNSLKVSLENALSALEENPRDKKLKSHKVVAAYDGKTAFSSSVTGDIRIIWRYQEDAVYVLDLLDIGGHSGNQKVYK